MDNTLSVIPLGGVEEIGLNMTVMEYGSDIHHPCQALANVMTLIEKKGKAEGLKVAYIGDGNNVCNSLIEAAALLGFNLTVACPEGFEPDAKIVSEARSYAKSEIVVLKDIY